MSNRRPAEPHYSGRSTGSFARSPAERLEPTTSAPASASEFRREPGPSRPVVRVLSGLLTLVLLVMLLAAGAAVMVQSQINAPGPLAQSKVLVVPKGDSSHEIAARLERDGFVSDRRLFVAGYLLAKVSSVGRRLAASATQGWRILDPAGFQRAADHRHRLRGQDDHLQGDGSRGADQRADRRAPEGGHQPLGRNRRSALGRLAAARDLHRPARGVPPVDHREDAGGVAQAGRETVGAAQEGFAAQDVGRGAGAGIDRGEGDGAQRRA